MKVNTHNTLTRMPGRLGRLLAVSAIGSLGLALPASGQSTIFSDDFSGSTGTDLDGQEPDIRPGTETWVAGSTIDADGAIADTANHTATLAFTPSSGTEYQLDVSLDDVTGTDGEWFSFGFADGQSSSTGNFNNRPNGIAWTLVQADASAAGNDHTFFLGTGSNGNDTTIAWENLSQIDGALDLRITLDTQPTTWTATWEAKAATDTSYTVVGSTADLLDQTAIASVGFGGRSNSATTVNSFTLTQIPEPSTYALIGGLLALGSVMLRRRRRRG